MKCAIRCYVSGFSCNLQQLKSKLLTCVVYSLLSSFASQ